MTNRLYIFAAAVICAVGAAVVSDADARWCMVNVGLLCTGFLVATMCGNAGDA